MPFAFACRAKAINSDAILYVDQYDNRDFERCNFYVQRQRPQRDVLTITTSVWYNNDHEKLATAYLLTSTYHYHTSTDDKHSKNCQAFICLSFPPTRETRAQRLPILIHHEEPLNNNHLPIRAVTNTNKRPATHQNLHNLRDMPPFHASTQPIFLQR